MLKKVRIFDHRKEEHSIDFHTYVFVSFLSARNPSNVGITKEGLFVFFFLLVFVLRLLYRVLILLWVGELPILFISQTA